MAAFDKEYEALRKLTPEETRKIVSAVCEAEEAERKDVSKEAGKRARDAVASKFKELEQRKDEAVKALDAVLSDKALESKHGEASKYRKDVLARWDSVDRMSKHVRGANHPVVAYMLAQGQDRARGLPGRSLRRGARMDSFCELAMALRVTAGCVSVELVVMAMDTGYGGSSHPAELADRQPGLTIRRLRERSAYNKRMLDREVPSPEWGLFLSAKHLEVVPAARLEASGVFHEVRRLADDLVFVQLTPDPADALREDYDAMLDPVRDILAPILADPNRPIHIE